MTAASKGGAVVALVAALGVLTTASVLADGPIITIAASAALRPLVEQVRTQHPGQPVRRTTFVTSDAAVVELDGSSDGSSFPEVDLVAVGQAVPVSASSPMSASAFVLGNVYGDGTMMVDVEVQECVGLGVSRMCGAIDRMNYALRSSGWTESQAPLPENPQTKIAISADPVPAFGVSFQWVSAQGVEGWDGQRFARDLKVFQPWYAQRLADARARAATIKAVAEKASICPWQAMNVASEVYAYGRITGTSEADALKEADDVMRGYSIAACAKDPNQRWRQPWATVRTNFAKAILPRLTRDRASVVRP